MSKAKDLKEFIETSLEDLGVARPYEFSIARNAHQQVIFYVKGIRVKYQFPFSPSDHRSKLNSRSSLKQAIRSASGHALSGASEKRSLLDARGLLPREPDHVGTGRAGVPKPAAPFYDRLTGRGQVH